VLNVFAEPFPYAHKQSTLLYPYNSEPAINDSRRSYIAFQRAKGWPNSNIPNTTIASRQPRWERYPQWPRPLSIMMSEEKT